MFFLRLCAAAAADASALIAPASSPRRGPLTALAMAIGGWGNLVAMVGLVGAYFFASLIPLGQVGGGLLRGCRQWSGVDARGEGADACARECCAVPRTLEMAAAGPALTSAPSSRSVPL